MTVTNFSAEELRRRGDRSAMRRCLQSKAVAPLRHHMTLYAAIVAATATLTQVFLGDVIHKLLWGG